RIGSFPGSLIHDRLYLCSISDEYGGTTVRPRGQIDRFNEIRQVLSCNLIYVMEKIDQITGSGSQLSCLGLQLISNGIAGQRLGVVAAGDVPVHVLQSVFRINSHTVGVRVSVGGPHESRIGPADFPDRSLGPDHIGVEPIAGTENVGWLGATPLVAAMIGEAAS